MKSSTKFRIGLYFVGLVFTNALGFSLNWAGFTADTSTFWFVYLPACLLFAVGVALGMALGAALIGELVAKNDV